MAVRLANPLQRIVGVGWGNATTEPVTTGPWYRICRHIPRPDLETDYEGEADSVVADSGGAKNQYEFFDSNVYNSDIEVGAAMDALPDDPYGKRVVRMLNTNDASTEPPDPLAVPYSDVAWTLFTSGGVTAQRDGFLPYFWKLGRLEASITPDPNCPPEDFFTIGNWATQEHAENYMDWQDTIGGSAGNSRTLALRSSPSDPTGSDVYCTPG